MFLMQESAGRPKGASRYNERSYRLTPDTVHMLPIQISLHAFLTRGSQRPVLAIAVLAMLGGCSSLNTASSTMAGIVSPYKMDIVQGNFVSKEQAAALKEGMSRLQVRDLLGTPLLVSVFHADRWDYVFTFKRKGAEPQARRVTVFFKGEALERFESDDLPTEAEFVASLDSGRSSGKVPVLEATEDSLAKYSRPVVQAESKVLPPLPDSYPPLEPASR
jgi:outer membrane protein assembly factor BamE